MYINRLLFIVVILLSTVDSFSQAFPEKQFDYASINFEMECVKIQGEMSFFNQQFITHESLSEGGTVKRCEKDHITHNSLGYGTYLFKIRIPEYAVGKRFLLHSSGNIEYTSEIYVNGKLCSNNGRVGRCVHDTMFVRSRKMTVSSFVADTSVLDVHVWVSNFHNSEGLTDGALYFGLKKQVTLRRERLIIIDLLIVVSLFIVGLFYLIMYAANRVDRKFLFFGLLSFTCCIDYSFKNAICFFVIFPDSLFYYYDLVHLYIRCFILAIYVLLFNSMYPQFVCRLATISICVIGFILSTLAVFCSEEQCYYIIIIYYTCIFGMSFYYAYKSCLLARSKEYGAVWFAVSSIVIFILVLAYIFWYFHLVNIPNLLPYGMVIFVFSLSILFVKMAINESASAQQFSVDLEIFNNQLETKVRNHTAGLAQSVELVKKGNDFQEGMTHMIIHDLKGPLMQILNVDIVESDFSNIRHAARVIVRLIQNIQSLYAFNKGDLLIVPTSFNVPQVIEEVLNDYMFYFTAKALKVKIVYTEVYNLKADVLIFKRIIGNLLFNAIRFSPSDAVITISLVVEADKSLKVVVTNEGPAIDEIVRARMFKSESINDITSDNRHNTSGLGLYLCKMAVDAHKGTIGVESDGIKGVDFWFTIPGSEVVKQETVSKYLVNTVDIEFTQRDVDLLQPYVKQLSVLQVYDSSQVDSVLSSIHLQGYMIEKWLNEIEKASYSLDETKYQDLLKLVHRDCSEIT